MQYMLFTKKDTIFKMLLTLMVGCALCFSAQTLAAPATSTTYDEEGPASAQQDLNSIMSAPEIGYYDLKPDFTTNLFSTGAGRLHYIRIKMSLMLSDSRDSDVIKSKEPLIRDAIVTILGAKDYASISSAVGRENLRVECRNKISELLKEKEGRQIIYDVLFTNYVYQ